MRKYLITIFFLCLFCCLSFAGSNVFLDNNRKSNILYGDIVNTVNGETGDVEISTSTITGFVLKSGDTMTGDLNLPNLNASGVVSASTGTFSSATISDNVGIGTASPAAGTCLDIVGSVVAKISIQSTAAGEGNCIRFKSQEGDYAYLGQDGNGMTGYTNDGLLLATWSAKPISFFTNQGERMRITETGLIGIGTDAPAEKLDVANGNIKTNYGIDASTGRIRGDFIINNGFGDGNLTIGTTYYTSNYDRLTIYDAVDGGCGIRIAARGLTGALDAYTKYETDARTYTIGAKQALGVPGMDVFQISTGTVLGQNVQFQLDGQTGDISIGTTTANGRLNVVGGSINCNYGISVATMAVNGLNDNSGNASLNDEASISIAVGNTSGGWGSVQAGDNEEWVDFCFTSAGVVTLKANSDNVVNTDTDGKFCIYDAGANPAIKNRLGSAKNVKYKIYY